MWNEDIPSAFRYQPAYYVWNFLLKYPHTIPKDGVLQVYLFRATSQPRTGWYMETTPLQNAEDYIAEFADLGMRFKTATDAEFGQIIIGAANLLYYITAEERSSIVYYYNGALKKIARILQGFDVGYEEPTPRLSALKDYSIITSRATNFINTAVGFNLDPLRNIVNNIKRTGLIERNTVYPRIQHLPKRFQLQGKDV